MPSSPVLSSDNRMDVNFHDAKVLKKKQIYNLFKIILNKRTLHALINPLTIQSGGIAASVGQMGVVVGGEIVVAGEILLGTHV